VPYDIWITRAENFADIAEAAERPTFWGRLLGGGRSRVLIGADEFHALMEDAPATRRPDGQTYWLRHINDDDPWATVRFQPAIRPGLGHIRMSLSLSSSVYFRNLGDLFDVSLRMAEALEARVFAGEEGRGVDVETLDQLLEPSGDFVQSQLSAWRALKSRLETQGQAPLEYPLGEVDAVPEYFCFYLHLGYALDVARLVEGLRGLDLSLVLQAHGARAFLLRDAARGVGVTKVLLRPDGDLQIWPVHWPGPFHHVARTSLRIALGTRELFGGRLTFFRQPLSEDLLSELRRRGEGLGVEFYEWRASLRG
jgi:hypothetical protein